MMSILVKCNDVYSRKNTNLTTKVRFLSENAKSLGGKLVVSIYCCTFVLKKSLPASCGKRIS